MNSEDACAVEMVRLGYAVDDPTDAKRCLDFHVAFHTVDAAMEAVRAIDQYNAFGADQVNEALESLKGIAQFGDPKVSVGREGSPVIYVTQLDAGGAEKVKVAMKAAEADEIDEVTGGGGVSFGLTVRAWWD